MAESKQRPNPKPDQPVSQSPSPEQAKADAEAQVHLMGDAAVDPRPLIKEEKDPIAQEVKESTSNSE